jgi:hypothetical protein
MPNMRDANVILGGQVIDVQDDVNRETGQFRGIKVSVLVAEDGEVGLAVVKVKTLSDTSLPIPRPAVGQSFAGVVRNAPWDVGGNSGMTTIFVRPVSTDDVDRILVHAALVPAKN